MVNVFSNFVVKHLLKMQLILDEESEIYRFGISCLLLKVVNLLAYFTIAFFLHEILTLCVLLITFVPLRQYAGGYHAKSSISCFCISLFCITTTLLLVKNYAELLYHSSNVICMISAILIFCFSPVENSHNPLNKVEKKLYKKRVHLILGTELASMLIFYLLDFWRITSVVALSLALVAAALVFGKFSGLKVESNLIEIG